MTWTVKEGQRPPITFHDPPTFERDGRRYITDEAARELGARVAARYETLLEKLAQE